MALSGPPLRVDLVLFGLRDDELNVLLWRRADAPYRGRWTLPGGFVGEKEPLEAAARRVLRERTGFEEDVYVEQLYTFCEPGMDPRGEIVSAAYFVVVSPSRSAPDGTFYPAKSAPALAFHHDQVLQKGVELGESAGTEARQ